MQLDLFAVPAVVAGGEGRAAVTAAEHRIQQPVFLTDKIADLFLAVDDHARGDALYAAGGQTLLDLFPQQRRELVADDAVQDAARLLGVDQILVDIAGLPDALGHDALGDLVESHAPRLLVGQLEQLLEVPGDRLAFAVRVGREIDGFGALGLGLQLLDQFAFILDGDILRLKAILDVHAHLALRQIAQMAHRGAYLKARPQVFFDRFCLRR